MNNTSSPVIGTKYGNWEVVSERVKRGSGRSLYWEVRCVCGLVSFRQRTSLINNKTNSCKSCSRTQLYKNAFSLSYFNRVKERARQINLEFDIDCDYIYDLLVLQEYKCALSGLPINFRKYWNMGTEQSASLDRIDNSKGYIKGNVQWLHKTINMMKHVNSQEEFIYLCKQVASKCS